MSEDLFHIEHPAEAAKWPSRVLGSFAILLAVLLPLVPGLGRLSVLCSVGLGIGVGGGAVYCCQRVLARARQDQQCWAAIAAASRVWALQVLGFVPTESAAAAAARGAAFPRQQQLLYRHVAWVRALQLPADVPATQREAALRPFLEAAELDWLRAKPGLPQLLLDQQAVALQRLHQGGGLPEPQLATLLGTLRRLEQLHFLWANRQLPKWIPWKQNALRQIRFPGNSRQRTGLRDDFSGATARAIETEILELTGQRVAGRAV